MKTSKLLLTTAIIASLGTTASRYYKSNIR